MRVVGGLGLSREVRWTFPKDLPFFGGRRGGVMEIPGMECFRCGKYPVSLVVGAGGMTENSQGG